MLLMVSSRRTWLCHALRRCVRRFVHDILHGVDIIMLAAKPNKPEAETAAAKVPAGSEAGSKAPSLEFVIHVVNAGIVLPSSSRCCLLALHHFPGLG